MGSSGAYFNLPQSDELRNAEEGYSPEIQRSSNIRNCRNVSITAVLVATIGFVLFLTFLGPSQLQPSHFVNMIGQSMSRPVLEACVPQEVSVPRLEDMTLDEKIGQMTQVDKNAILDLNDIAKYHIGSILSGGGGAPFWGNQPSDWADMVDNYQVWASRTRLQIPMLYGVDAVHGHNNVYGTTIFPHHVALGATRDQELVREIGAAAAREVAATGIRWAFSPAVSVCRDPRWGRCYESFSEETTVVQKLTSEITGWQSRSTDANDPSNSVPGSVLVAATAKHFVGDGGTQGGKDEGNTIVSEEELRRVHLPPYYDAIARDVQTVMISYSSWNGQKMHGNRYLITDVLKGEMGFKGLVISDWAALQQLPGTWAEQVRASINAGLDMIMVPTTYKEFISTLKDEVLSGRVPMSRIDDAVARILQVKKNLGLFENGCAPRQLHSTIGAPEHRQVARRAVAESLVLLKNERRSAFSNEADSAYPDSSLFPLPLSSSTKILVTGSHANNIGLQCGGWTIQWQGSSGNITKGTTVFQGIQSAVHEKVPGADLQYVEHPSGNEEADYGIVVVGELPYAEFMGDNEGLQLDASAHAAIDNVCGRMPCVVVLISGRAMDITHVLPKVDAMVAAWLPGTEGNGVADVLFGDKDFSGRLPVTWYQSTVQLPMTYDNSPYTPLFPFGFGLDTRGNRLPEFNWS